MMRKRPFKALGKNDVWLAIFIVAALVIAGLIANGTQPGGPIHPAPVPASSLKD